MKKQRIFVLFIILSCILCSFVSSMCHFDIKCWNKATNSIRKELCTLFCLVKVYGLSGVYAFFRIFVLSTSPYSEGQKFCNHFFKTYPYNPYSILFPSLTKGRRKYSWHYCTFCTIALSAKVRKCKSASGMVCCIMEDGQDLTVQIPFPFCSLLTSSFQRRKESMLTDWNVRIPTNLRGKNQDEGLMCFDAFCPLKVSNWRNDPFEKR